MRDQLEDRIRSVLPPKGDWELSRAARDRIATRLDIPEQRRRPWLAFAFIGAAVTTTAVIVTAAVALQTSPVGSRGAPLESSPTAVPRLSPSGAPTQPPSPSGPASPTILAAHAFGKLPLLPESAGGVAGPGPNEITFAFAPGTSLPPLDHAIVRQAEAPAWTATDAAAIAGRLGFEGSPRVSEYSDFTSWSWNAGQQGLEIDGVGSLNFTDYAPGAGGTSSDQLAETARRWLATRQLLPAQVAPQPRIEGAGPYTVTFRGDPAVFGDPSDGPFPFLTVTLSPEGGVQEVSYRWANVTALSDYPLADPQGLLNLLNKYGAALNIEAQGLAPGDLSGSATIESGALTTTAAGGEDRRVTFVAPGYLLSGTITLANGDRAPFTAVVPAIDPAWLQ
jgi:hypothetical protein